MCIQDYAVYFFRNKILTLTYSRVQSDGKKKVKVLQGQTRI